MKETKVKCPCCGAEFAIPSHEQMVAGLAIGKDSNLGTIYLPLEKEGKKTSVATSKAERRIAQLEASGVDTRGYYAMSDGENIVRFSNGLMEQLGQEELDNIDALIVKGGVIPNSRLFRRWIMAQMLRMLSYKSWNGRKKGYTEYLHILGYEYQFKMLKNEFYAQMKMEKDGDTERLAKRRYFFNGKVAVSVMNSDYMWLNSHLGKLRIRHCQGRPYKHVGGRNVFCDEIDAKILTPMRNAINAMCLVENSAAETYRIFCDYLKCRVKLNHGEKQNREWIDAFKGAGAYYTMDNLILFHGCNFKMNSNEFFSQSESKEILDRLVATKKEGWELLGILKGLIADNNIDIAAKMAEWRKN